MIHRVTVGEKNVFLLEPWQRGDNESRVSIDWNDLYNKILPSSVTIVHRQHKECLAVTLFSMILLQGWIQQPRHPALEEADCAEVCRQEREVSMWEACGNGRR